jgi:hypothetical protein
MRFIHPPCLLVVPLSAPASLRPLAGLKGFRGADLFRASRVAQFREHAIDDHGRQLRLVGEFLGGARSDL